MKNLLVVILSLFVMGPSNAQIPNAGFEDWLTYSGSTFIGLPFTGQRPLSWSTTDSIIQRFTGPSSVFAGSDAFTGDSAIHLKTVTVALVNNAKVPGIATNGTITFIQSPLSFIISGGTPDTSRSRKLLGRYKFSTTGTNDSARISVFKTRFNPGTGSREIISSGILFLTNSNNSSAYVPFEVQLEYQNWRDRPDSCLIILQSGQAEGDLTTLQLTNGTELVIDDLSFDGFVGINEPDAEILSSFRLFPTPASDFVNVDVTALNPSLRLTCLLTDITGRMVLEASVNQGGHRLDISALPAGNYMMQLLDEDRSVIAARKFSVAR